jgi:hypothetical protein
MNDANFKGIRIARRDFLNLPTSMRLIHDGLCVRLFVLSVVRGREMFVPALIID